MFEWADIDKLTAQMLIDLADKKDRKVLGSVGNLSEKVNLDEDGNYKHYYDINEKGKWKVRGRA